MAVVAAEGAAGAPPQASAATSPSAADAKPPLPDRQQDVLKQQALADTGVQAMLDVFAAEIKDVEEM